MGPFSGYGIGPSVLTAGFDGCGPAIVVLLRWWTGRQAGLPPARDSGKADEFPRQASAILADGCRRDGAGPDADNCERLDDLA
ncbi:hypothetical protein NJB1728216S_07890 [Mycobacterium marinum]|nr:hypothetical protein NJB1907f34b_32120 [Mycobacterium marinum]GJO13389.1 hypothetical protein NJB1728e18_01900 [Mycobacterium marinum]GJO19012.1 hypothetical protein NJB1907E11_24110 [Mycobacterium marinum]GJO28668.1 hypothetical protein NJB1907f22_22390 [Mycobacterium marinum]GJO49514.1 hypothetical protein NJB1907f3_23560 [Mycobacterium marinum]